MSQLEYTRTICDLYHDDELIGNARNVLANRRAIARAVSEKTAVGYTRAMMFVEQIISERISKTGGEKT